MADVSEKAKKFASDSAKAKGNYNFVKVVFFPLKSMTKVHLLNVCYCEKIGKIIEKLRSVSLFGQVLHYFRFSVSATNFHLGASLILSDVGCFIKSGAPGV